MKTGQTLQRHRLGSPWRDRIILANRRELLLRPVMPADAEPISVGFALLSPEEIRLRYQHPMKSLGERYVHRLTHPRRGRDFVLVLAEPFPPGEALIGAVARLSREDHADEAEFAIIVSRFLAGQGLGRVMLGKLIAHARLSRLKAIYGDVLDDNKPMLQLAQALGFRREPSTNAGAVRVRLALPAHNAGHPCEHDAGRTAALG